MLRQKRDLGSGGESVIPPQQRKIIAMCVENIGLHGKELMLDVSPRWRRPRCPVCGKAGTIHATSDAVRENGGRWNHLPATTTASAFVVVAHGVSARVVKPAASSWGPRLSTSVLRFFPLALRVMRRRSVRSKRTKPPGEFSETTAAALFSRVNHVARLSNVDAPSKRDLGSGARA